MAVAVAEAWEAAAGHGEAAVEATKAAPVLWARKRRRGEGDSGRVGRGWKCVEYAYAYCKETSPSPSPSLPRALSILCVRDRVEHSCANSKIPWSR